VAGPVPSAGPHHGRVASFDQRRGLGTVADDTGTSYGFHATAIADGSRRIEVGRAVTFAVAPGRRGVYEARSLVPVPVSSDPAGWASHHRPA
jgi:cold shock CspA family protein